jgi:hypothetical protein
MRIGQRMKEILAYYSKENAPVQGIIKIIQEYRGPLPVKQKERDCLFALYSRARKSLMNYGLIEHVYYRAVFDSEKEHNPYLSGYMLAKTLPTKESMAAAMNKVWCGFPRRRNLHN